MTVRDDLQQEVTADEPDEREEHHPAGDDLSVEVVRDLEWVRRGGDRRDPVRRRLLDRVTGRVVLLEQLDAIDRLLIRIDLLLVVDEIPEVPDEREEEQEAGRGQEEVGIHQASGTWTCAGSHSLFGRFMTFSGLVSTMSAPFTSLTLKRSRPRGAGPPALSAVSLL